MSASLVGSEMCIRDRLYCIGVPPPAYLPLYHLAQYHAHPGAKTHRTGAVSYTHLTLPTICSV
eukprot:8058840-Alexandrium_andersonii.AAC.1